MEDAVEDAEAPGGSCSPFTCNPHHQAQDCRPGGAVSGSQAQA